MMRMKKEQWDDVINVNLTGVFLATQVCAAGLAAGLHAGSSLREPYLAVTAHALCPTLVPHPPTPHACLYACAPGWQHTLLQVLQASPPVRLHTRLAGSPH